MVLHPLAVAIAATLVLGVAKLAVALLTGSQAVMASAADSLGDAIVSGVNLIMVRQAAEPPDEGHPWGHGKAEALASLAQVAVLAVVVGAIGVNAVGTLLGGAGTVPAAGPTLGVMAVSMLGSLSISAYLSRAARRTGSLLIKSDAVHYRMDLWSGAAVVLGLVASQVLGNAVGDAGASLLVSAIMVKDVYGVGREAIDELMDRPLPPEETAQIESALREMGAPLVSWHDLRTRRSGPHRFVQVHVVLPADIPFAEAHAAADAVEARLRGALPNLDVIVHADPEGVEETP
ncbi:MAG: cation transporter [Deltaproteobacteria bacterium]|nr:cation transporter [Deltaproteobacteria bacterium]